MFGLFESETVVSVSTSVSRVIEDRLLPDSVKTGTIKGIMTEGGQLVENIMEDVISSIGVKGERMYRYAKNGYLYGAPTSHLYKSRSADAIAKAALETYIGHPLTFEYLRYAPLNRQHYGWQCLYDSYGYNPRTNEITSLSATKGAPVYLENMQVVLAQDTLSVLTGTALEQWGAAASSGYTPLRPYTLSTTVAQTPIGIQTVEPLDYLQVTYVWQNASGVQRDTLAILLPPAGENATYVQAKYSYQVLSHKTYEPDPRGFWYGTVAVNHYNYFTEYFTYRIGDGIHADLDNLFSSEYNDLGSFFPFCYFRYDKQPTSTDPNSQEYKSSTKLLNYLGMSYNGINEAINSNPDINDVQSALLMWAVPAVSSDPIENQYLFDFFRGIYVQSGPVAVPEIGEEPWNSSIAHITQGLQNDQSATSRISLVIQDTRLHTSLNMSGIYRRLVPGVIGKIGTHTSNTGTDIKKHSAVIYGELDEQGKQIESTFTWKTSEPAHFYRKQITEHLYEEISVHNLRRTYKVDGGHATTNDMVPLDHSITENYSIPERERLYARSLHYVFNSRRETELEWYQQEWFSTVVIVIAVVWTAFSMGSDGGAGLGAAMAAGTVTLANVVVTLLIAAAWYVGIKVVSKLFVKLLGAEAALIFAVIVAAYGMYTQYGMAGGVKGAPWAEQLLPLSNSLMSEAEASYTKDLELLKEESDQFNLFAKAKTDELTKIQEELEGSRILSPFVLFGEEPQEYYNRTIHAGNIGINSIAAISNYCDISLKLPTLEQTLSMEEA